MSAPPLAGLAGLVAFMLLCLPFYRLLTLPVGPVHLSIADGITILCGLYIGSAFCMGRPIAWPTLAFSIGLGLYLFAVAGSIIDAHSRSRSLHYLASILLDLVLFSTVYQAVRSGPRLRILVLCYVLACVVVASIASAQGLALVSGGMMESVSGTLNARNEMVFILLPGLAMALACSFEVGPKRWFYVAAAIVMLAAIALSRGRAGMAFAVALMALVPLLVRRARSLRITEVLALWGLLALLGWAFFSLGGMGETLIARYTQSLQTEFQDQRGSAWTRFEVLRGTLNAFESNPLFGIGADNFKLVSGSYVDAGDLGGIHDLSEIQPHSTYLGSLAETGLLGFSGFLILIGSGLACLRNLRFARSADRPVVAGVTAGFAILAAYLLVFDAGARPITWMLLAAALATRDIARSPRYRPTVVHLA